MVYALGQILIRYSLIGRVAMGWSGAERRLFKRMLPVIQNRLMAVDGNDEKSVRQDNGLEEPDLFDIC